MSVLLFKNKNVIVEGKVIEHTVPYREKFYQLQLGGGAIYGKGKLVPGTVELEFVSGIEINHNDQCELIIEDRKVNLRIKKISALVLDNGDIEYKVEGTYMN
ncbi:hypothetical protein ACFPU1_02970 [Thalassorhabdus alkalitolerans]|uniref:Uncharacterized protein n=1 Tax=Thalassorhabdus alkalitolerans TaxID=2282697 RepID=A0ABW0YH56_9BACI